MSTGYKTRCFVITDFEMDISVWEQNRPLYTYMAYGEETCPTTGKKHWQGYLHCKNRRYVNSVRKEWKPRHIEIMKGTFTQNEQYCSKEGKLVEFGEKKKPGKRSDLDDVREILNNGGSMSDVVEEATSFQSIRMAEVILKYKEVKRTWKPKIYWFYGDTATGKTRTAYEMFPDAWISGKNLKWWEGYDAHENVIIDDFRGDFCTFHELLRILDRYEYRIECKGGSRQLVAKNIVVTCPRRPDEIYSVREDIGQLLRRIDEVREFKNGPEVMDQRSGVILDPRPMNDLEIIAKLSGWNKED